MDNGYAYSAAFLVNDTSELFPEEAFHAVGWPTMTLRNTSNSIRKHWKPIQVLISFWYEKAAPEIPLQENSLFYSFMKPFAEDNEHGRLGYWILDHSYCGLQPFFIDSHLRKG